MHPVRLRIIGDGLHRALCEQAEAGDATAATFADAATAALALPCMACGRFVSSQNAFAVLCIGGDREPLQAAAICHECITCREGDAVVETAFLARAGQAAAARSGATFHPAGGCA